MYPTHPDALESRATGAPRPADAAMDGRERRAALSLAGIFSLRMLGLFMIYPVFAVWARHLPGASPTTIGLALGVYGLTQALLQIPFGFLSDRLGRERVIAAGLVLFAVGSVVAALAPTIRLIIFGRLLQGAGAIGSAVLALAADLTRTQHRTKAMAIIGVTIGAAFAMAMVLGPVLDNWIGIRGIFWLTAVLAALGIAVLYGAVPREPAVRSEAPVEPAGRLFRSVLADPDLRRLNLGIFCLHAVLTASFLTIPFVLGDAGVAVSRQWLAYLPVLLASVVLLVPLVIAAERGRMRGVFLAMIALLGGAEILLGVATHLVPVLVALLAFFTAFNVLESVLPSLISRAAPSAAKGTAMGVYSSAQFLGIFVGGATGGLIKSAWGIAGVAGFCVALLAGWLVVAWLAGKPCHALSGAVRGVDAEAR
jgi:predicted MFS family arabinose efflux permease